MKTINQLFAQITTSIQPARGAASKAASEAIRKERCSKLLASLASGKRSAKKYDSKDKATRKLVPVERTMTPGKLVQIAIKAAKYGATVEDFAATKIAERFDWKLVGESILAAAREEKLGEVAIDVISHAFGLVAVEDVVVPSAPGESEPAVEIIEEQEPSELRPSMTKAERRRASKRAA